MSNNLCIKRSLQLRLEKFKIYTTNDSMLKISHLIYIFRANNYVLKYDADEKQLSSN